MTYLSIRCFWMLAPLAALSVACSRGSDRTALATPAASSEFRLVAASPSISSPRREPEPILAAPAPNPALDVPPGDVPLWLPHFYRALHELSLSRRADHVRIAWFGDSHTNADFWTGELRRRLQRRFGNGGPGFVHVGVRSTRHDQVLSESFGKWVTSPPSPASYERQDDGVFGLAGMRSEAQSYSAEVQFRLMPGARPEFPPNAEMRWELIWRLPSAQSSFTLTAGSQKPRTITFSGPVARSDKERGVRVRASQLMGLTVLTNKLSDRLRIHQTAAKPQFFGIIGELTTPGVVLDALGINGARLRTMLGWQEGVWLGELVERDPQLIVLAYGTNEIGDGTDLATYRSYYAELLGRIGESLPNADCLIIGPTERTDSEWKTRERAIEIDRVQREAALELGCAYHSPLQVMTSSGGQRAWIMAIPQLARGDRVHLTRAGYEKLAEALDGELTQSFARLYGGDSESSL